MTGSEAKASSATSATAQTRKKEAGKTKTLQKKAPKKKVLQKKAPELNCFQKKFRREWLLRQKALREKAEMALKEKALKEKAVVQSLLQNWKAREVERVERVKGVDQEGQGEETQTKANRLDTDWYQHAEQLYEYVAMYQRLPRRAAGARYPKEAQLGAWAKEQVVQLRQGKLAADHAELLQHIHGALGLAPPATEEERWEARFEELVDVPVPLAAPQPRPASAATPPRPSRPRTEEEPWEERFQRLEEYAKGNGGDANVVREGDTGDEELWEWARDQRTAFRSGALGRERSERLRAIGLDLCGQRTYRRRYNHARFSVLWERNFAHLVEYQQEHGHCRVPFSYATERHGKLGHWVTDQRRKGAGTYKGAKGEKVELCKSKVAKVSLVRARSEFNNVNMN